MIASLKKLFDKIVQPLHESFLAATAEIRSVESAKPTVPTKHADKILAQAIIALQQFPLRITDSFVKLTHQARLTYQEYYAFQLAHGGLSRPADMPKVENAIAIMVGVWFIESLCAGAVYALDGSMKFIEGIGYAGVFSFCDLTVALMIGATLRYACLTYHDHFNLTTLRRLSWMGIVLWSILLAVLIATGARVRGLGRSDDIWNLADLGVWATFTDAYTILFLAIALMSSVYAIFKGAMAFSDFIPGYTVKQKGVSAIDEAGEDLAEHLEAVIEHTADSALDQFEQAQTEPEELEAYIEGRQAVIEQCEQHNIHVREGESELHHLKEQADANPSSALVTNLAHLMIDIAAVEKRLALPPVPPRTEDLIGKLEHETQLALTACKETLLTYLRIDKRDDDEEEATAHV